MKLIMIIIFLLTLIISCKKENPTCNCECGVNHDKTANKMEGKWKLVEVITDSVKLYNTGENFIFYECKNPDFGNCAGVFITNNGVLEKFEWILKGNTYSWQAKDNNSELVKYYDYMSSIQVCRSNTLAFRQLNREIKLEKSK